MMNLFRNIRVVLAQYREYQTVAAELGSYTDRQLAEIGLARGDVHRLAYEEAERRVAHLAPRHAGAAAPTERSLAPAKA
jgi:uncharacterized protein YjiS (DUF1127 family)